MLSFILKTLMEIINVEYNKFTLLFLRSAEKVNLIFPF